MSYKDGHISRVVDLLSLLHKAPRTKPELAELTGLTKTSVARWVSAMEAEGLIEMTGRRRDVPRGCVPLLFGWTGQRAS